MSSRGPLSRRRWGVGSLFIAAWIAVIVFGLVATSIGMSIAGGPAAFHHWVQSATPGFMVWRALLFGGGGLLYITRWRPRLRAAQRDRPDGGQAAYARLIRAERMMVVAIIFIEATNLPGEIAFFSG
ncbi:MAG: hypothetical protein PF501_16865 [Salinisphaera sp.]|nr:hypothetical protein [Salinisphaera sp.]